MKQILTEMVKSTMKVILVNELLMHCYDLLNRICKDDDSLMSKTDLSQLFYKL